MGGGVSKDLISKATRNEFRELLTGSTLREIGMTFDAGDLTPLEGYQPTVGGQRRGLVEAYYANIDFTSPADVRKVLAVYEEIVETLTQAAHRSPNENYGVTLTSLLRRMERDGFRYDNGHFVSPVLSAAILNVPSLVQLTEESLHEDVEKARQKIASGDAAGAITNAYTLMEHFLKQLLRKTGASSKRTKVTSARTTSSPPVPCILTRRANRWRTTSRRSWKGSSGRSAGSLNSPTRPATGTRANTILRRITRSSR